MIALGMVAQVGEGAFPDAIMLTPKTSSGMSYQTSSKSFNDTFKEVVFIKKNISVELNKSRHTGNVSHLTQNITPCRFFYNSAK